MPSDQEDGHRPGHRDPDPGLLRALRPAGLVDVRIEAPGVSGRLVVDRAQGVAGPGLELADAAQGDRDVEEIGEERGDGPLAQAADAAEVGRRRLEPGTEAGGRLGDGQGGGPGPDSRDNSGCDGDGGRRAASPRADR